LTSWTETSPSWTETSSTSYTTSSTPAHSELPLWLYGGAGQEGYFGNHLDVDSQNNVFVATTFLSDDFMVAGNTLSRLGSYDSLVLKIDSATRNATWGVSFGGTG
jgi:hypothetical protein